MIKHQIQTAGISMQIIAATCAGIAIIVSAFHFWPFENNKAWQMFSPQNSSVLAWSLFLAMLFLLNYNRHQIIALMPHLSVFSYLGINVLSMMFASDMTRTAGFTIKLALTVIGGYMLFNSAIFSTKSLRLIYAMATAAMIISLSACLAVRFWFGCDKFGFHINAYKYGTYIGILTPLCTAYLFTSSKNWKIIAGMILVFAAIISSGSFGGIAAIFTGVLTTAVIVPRWSVRIAILTAVILGAGFSSVGDDIKLVEKDGTNLKQRYIEWQAEINLLENRTIMGTAAGCINEYRSNFYYRLPKLNTLKPFDQNGWLAAGAETGVAGLVCFCWVVLHYGKTAFLNVIDSRWKNNRIFDRFAAANFAGLSAACAANLFSSLQYNGIVIIFVMVIALISGTNRLSEENLR
jgi:hypothetical protein